MPSFDARLRLPGQTRLPLSVVVDVSDEEMVITSGQENLGAWALQGLRVEARSDGFHLTLDQDEIILNVAEPDRFATQLGVTPLSPDQKGGTVGGGAPVVALDEKERRPGISGRLDGVDAEERFDDLRRRISALATALTDESVAPSDLFGRWLRLLKEINRHHGQGAMPTPLFYRWNTELLDLIPAPPPPPPPQVVEARERAGQPETT